MASASLLLVLGKVTVTWIISPSLPLPWFSFPCATLSHTHSTGLRFCFVSVLLRSKSKASKGSSLRVSHRAYNGDCLHLLVGGGSLENFECATRAYQHILVSWGSWLCFSSYHWCQCPSRWLQRSIPIEYTTINICHVSRELIQLLYTYAGFNVGKGWIDHSYRPI